MLVAEYSYEEDIRVKQDEARQIDLQQGIEQMVTNALTTTKDIHQTALILHLDEKEIKKIAYTNEIDIDA